MHARHDDLEEMDEMGKNLRIRLGSMKEWREQWTNRTFVEGAHVTTEWTTLVLIEFHEEFLVFCSTRIRYSYFMFVSFVLNCIFYLNEDIYSACN